MLILPVTEALGNILKWAWGRKADERWCRTRQGGHANVLGVSPGLKVPHHRPVSLSTCWLPCPSCPTSLVGTELKRWESIRSGQVIISFSSLEAFLALIGGGSMSQWWAAECQTRGRRRNTHRCQTNGLISRPESGMRQISVDDQQEALALFSYDYFEYVYRTAYERRTSSQPLRDGFRDASYPWYSLRIYRRGVPFFR